MKLNRNQKISASLLAGIIAWGLIPQANAMGQKKVDAAPQWKEEPASPSPVQIDAPTQATLQQIYDEALKEIKNAESLIQAQSFGPAMLTAKKVVDRTAVIHPKGNYSTHIQVSNIIKPQDRHKDFNDLNNQQKEALAQAVAGQKGGFYLDILNLYKRAKLIYLKAMYQQMQGRLMARDIEKMKTDLISIHNVALLINEEMLGDSYMIFDVDVANPDQQYFFNRELLAFAVEVKEFQMNEASFDQALAKDRAERLQAHRKGRLAGNSNLPASQLYETSSYKNCLSLLRYRDYEYYGSNYDSTQSTPCVYYNGQRGICTTRETAERRASFCSKAAQTVKFTAKLSQSVETCSDETLGHTYNSLERSISAVKQCLAGNGYLVSE